MVKFEDEYKKRVEQPKNNKVKKKKREILVKIWEKFKYLNRVVRQNYYYILISINIYQGRFILTEFHTFKTEVLEYVQQVDQNVKTVEQRLEQSSRLTLWREYGKPVVANMLVTSGQNVINSLLQGNIEFSFPGFTSKKQFEQMKTELSMAETQLTKLTDKHENAKRKFAELLFINEELGKERDFLVKQVKFVRSDISNLRRENQNLGRVLQQREINDQINQKIQKERKRVQKEIENFRKEKEKKENKPGFWGQLKGRVFTAAATRTVEVVGDVTTTHFTRPPSEAQENYKIEIKREKKNAKIWNREIRKFGKATNKIGKKVSQAGKGIKNSAKNFAQSAKNTLKEETKSSKNKKQTPKRDTTYYGVYGAHHPARPAESDPIGKKYATRVEPPKLAQKVGRFILKRSLNKFWKDS